MGVHRWFVMIKAHCMICRAWQLFDWVRGLPEDHALARLCDADSYTTMIALCGPWQQLRRALQLIADMRTQGIECGVQVGCPCVHAAALPVEDLQLSSARVRTCADDQQ